MSRRGVLMAGVAGAAAAAGLGWGLWRGRGPAPEQLVWQATLKGLDGEAVPLTRWQGRPLLLNFWATWCPPCVREMPVFDRFHKQRSAQGWQVVGVAIDKADAVRQFLTRQPVSYPILLAGLEAAELMQALGNLQGGLPFTVLLDAAGHVKQRHLGETTETQLTSWAV